MSIMYADISGKDGVMTKFKHRPIVVEAMQFFNGDGPNNITECLCFGSDMLAFETEDNTLRIPTLEGELIARNCDWLVKETNGMIVSYSPENFEALYEVA